MDIVSDTCPEIANQVCLLLLHAHFKPSDKIFCGEGWVDENGKKKFILEPQFSRGTEGPFVFRSPDGERIYPIAFARGFKPNMDEFEAVAKLSKIISDVGLSNIAGVELVRAVDIGTRREGQKGVEIDFGGKTELFFADQDDQVFSKMNGWKVTTHWSISSRDSSNVNTDYCHEHIYHVNYFTYYGHD
jgi:hypothetical protein